ncbi:MAG: hypothetical protein JO202_03020 [Ktedonobacteraceae bacterium]|nr:hypothetical protein [Ktedonobacteraceae bacterium]
MITEQEQAKIRLLSDTELYRQAVDFMRGIAKPIPQKQTNGLLNVSLANTYDQLQKFVARQRDRETWPPTERHIRIFYRELGQKLKRMDDLYVSSIMKARTKPAPQEDIQTLRMLLAREFIQHVLAENAYMGAIRAFQNVDLDNSRNQGRPQGNNRAPVTRQGRT